MSIDWDGYEIYDSGVSGPSSTLPCAEAPRAYLRLMEAKPARIEMLRRLLKATMSNSVTDVTGGVSGYGYGPGHLLATITDPRGAVTTNTYDGQGQRPARPARWHNPVRLRGGADHDHRPGRVGHR